MGIGNGKTKGGGRAAYEGVFGVNRFAKAQARAAETEAQEREEEVAKPHWTTWPSVLDGRSRDRTTGTMGLSGAGASGLWQEPSRSLLSGSGGFGGIRRQHAGAGLDSAAPATGREAAQAARSRERQLSTSPFGHDAGLGRSGSQQSDVRHGRSSAGEAAQPGDSRRLLQERFLLYQGHDACDSDALREEYETLRRSLRGKPGDLLSESQRSANLRRLREIRDQLKERGVKVTPFVENAHASISPGTSGAHEPRGVLDKAADDLVAGAADGWEQIMRQYRERKPQTATKHRPRHEPDIDVGQLRDDLVRGRDDGRYQLDRLLGKLFPQGDDAAKRNPPRRAEVDIDEAQAREDLIRGRDEVLHQAGRLLRQVFSHDQGAVKYPPTPHRSPDIDAWQAREDLIKGMDWNTLDEQGKLAWKHFRVLYPEILKFTAEELIDTLSAVSPPDYGSLIVLLKNKLDRMEVLEKQGSDLNELQGRMMDWYNSQR